ncbi:hypothetical protein [uncultured Piscinibacter sp.]|uniref:hypothetical protein n=1 Tax=uncultured Piscinibacter sp. TaxID=1131835 RepID=UPI0026149B79|nr:hypothetical protein [uncultured Piscinibacter sp.]
MTGAQWGDPSSTLEQGQATMRTCHRLFVAALPSAAGAAQVAPTRHRFSIPSAAGKRFNKES